MRKLILAMQISLDGFIEGPDGDMSWMDQNDEEAWQDLFEMLKSVDLFLLGRGMYSDYRNYWKQALTDSGFTANEVAYARLAEKTKHIVFSNTLRDSLWENTSVLSGDISVAVAEIKKQPGKDIHLVGGARLAAAVMEAGLVDEYRLNINPIIVGSGKSFFQGQDHKHELKLINTKILTSGVIIARYKSTNCKPIPAILLVR